MVCQRSAVMTKSILLTVLSSNTSSKFGSAALLWVALVQSVTSKSASSTVSLTVVGSVMSSSLLQPATRAIARKRTTDTNTVVIDLFLRRFMIKLLNWVIRESVSTLTKPNSGRRNVFRIKYIVASQTRVRDQADCSRLTQNRPFCSIRPFQKRENIPKRVTTGEPILLTHFVSVD